MRIGSEKLDATDLFTSLIRSQINQLIKVLQHIENGNRINGYVNENLRLVEKDLRWLRKYYFSN